MIPKSDSLKMTERRAYRSYYNDGVFDVFFGFVFMVFAWMPIAVEVGVPTVHLYLVLVLATPVAWLVRRHVTIPRIGLVEFAEKRRAKKWMLAASSMMVLFLILPLIIASGSGVNELVVVPIIALLVCLAGYFLDYPRMYIYGALLVYGIVQARFLVGFAGSPLHSLISLGIPGMGIMIYGIALLYKFLVRYPKPGVGNVD